MTWKFMASIAGTVPRDAALRTEVEAQRFYNRRIHFLDQKTETFRSLPRSESEALNPLEKAAETDHRPMILRAAKGRPVAAIAGHSCCLGMSVTVGNNLSRDMLLSESV